MCSSIEHKRPLLASELDLPPKVSATLESVFNLNCK